MFMITSQRESKFWVNYVYYYFLSLPVLFESTESCCCHFDVGVVIGVTLFKKFYVKVFVREFFPVLYQYVFSFFFWSF